ncbi:unknown [Prevotella sp. CAG:924]|nr:unknown [Prevotella sp. CAG:924]
MADVYPNCSLFRIILIGPSGVFRSPTVVPSVTLSQRNVLRQVNEDEGDRWPAGG